MKRKFLFVFSTVLAVTIVSLIYTTTNIQEQHPRKSSSQSDNKIVVVNYESVANCNTSSSDTSEKINSKIKKVGDTVEDVGVKEPIDFVSKYSSLLKCKHSSFNEWHPGDKVEPPDSIYEFSRPADLKFHEERITRGILVYFPIGSESYYRNELRWLYRSWINMIRFEPAKWRTDLIVFVERDEVLFNSSEFFMNQLNCRFENVRKSAEDKPMCTLVHYVALKKRTFDLPERKWSNADEMYQYLLRQVDIFKLQNAEQLDPFYRLMKKSLSEYGYLDSILMAFEG